MINQQNFACFAKFYVYDSVIVKTCKIVIVLKLFLLSLFLSLLLSLPPLSIIFSVDDDSIQGQWLKQQQDKEEFLQQPFTELAARAQYYSKSEEEEKREGDHHLLRDLILMVHGRL